MNLLALSDRVCAAPDCEELIPVLRIESIGRKRCRTCSPACSKALTKEQNKQALRRFYERQRAKRQAEGVGK